MQPKKKRWIAFANANRCDHYASLKEAGFISWKKERNNFAIGDIVYLFNSFERKIIFKTEVERQEMRADGKYWKETPPNHMTWRLKAITEYTGECLNEEQLVRHGFKGGRSLQHPSCNNTELLDYIESEFNKQ